MLSVHKIRGGDGYLAYLTAEYYLGEEQFGEWYGQGAKALGLRGRVQAEQLRMVVEGYRPDGRKLVASAGQKPHPKTGKGGHQAGWDLTFSPPKPFGVLWSGADAETRAKLEAAHGDSVKEVLSYLEQVAGFVRVRTKKGGVVLAPAKLVVALFNHATSRAGDPMPHTHCFVANAGVDAGGGTRGLDSTGFYILKMTAGALYRAGLANRLRNEHGLEVTPDEQKAWTIRGVPEVLVKLYSKRREQVLAALGEFTAKGQRRASARAAEVATKATRRKKQDRPIEESRREWHETNHKHGFTEEKARSLFGRVQPNLTADLTALIGQAAEDITKRECYFTKAQLIRATAELCMDGKATIAAIIKAVTKEVEETDRFFDLGIERKRRWYTTREVMKRERELLADIDKLHADKSHRVKPDRAIGKLLNKQFPTEGRGLSPDELTRNKEQRAAVEYLTMTGGGISSLAGMAGTGKTTVLETCRKIWERAGYTVIGTSLGGVAADGLQEKAGIPSETLAKRLMQLGEAVDLPGVKPGKVKVPKLKLTPKTIVVLDEAGMVGTEQLHKLIRHITAAGAKYVPTGDGLQLQPIEAGGPFASVVNRVGGAVLKHITRQKRQENDPSPTWARDAVRHLAAGEAKQGLGLFDQRGLVIRTDSRSDAIKRMVQDWAKGGGADKPADWVLLAATRAEVAAINAECQRVRDARGLKGKLVTSLPGRILKSVTIENDGNKERIHLGDRVLFTKNSSTIGVRNGNFGTVKGVTVTSTGKVLKVRLGGNEGEWGKSVYVPVRYYKHLQLGYAASTHKLQGVTCERASVLLGGSMQDLHLSYVQGSRAKHETRFYVDRFEAGGKELEELCVQMSRNRQKELAHDLMERARKPMPLRTDSESHSTSQSQSRSQGIHHSHKVGQSP